MYYDYSYYYGGEDMLEIILISGLYLLTSVGFAVTLYIFRALGLQGIARNRGLKHGWFAWIPVLDQYLLGCISDQYQYVVKGKQKNRRKILLVLNIAYGVVFVAILIAAITVVSRATMGYINERGMIAQTMKLMSLFLPLAVFAITVQVVRFIALYDLYVSVDPKNSTMYLVLSILFNVTEPFFIFFNRKKEDGMPPRREPVQPQWETPVEEPWVNE